MHQRESRWREAGVHGSWRWLVLLLALAGALPGPAGNGATNKGLVGYWPLDEKNDSVLNAATLNLDGATCGARRVSGRKGLAVQFDGINDFGLIEERSGFQLEREVTLAAWVRMDHLPQLTFRNDFRLILGKPSLDSLSFVLEKDGHVSASVWVNGRRVVARSADGLPVGVWTHLALTFDGHSGALALYVNGKLSNTVKSEMVGFIDGDTSPFVLGARGSPANAEIVGGLRSFPGALDEVRLYNRVLSPAEVLTLAQEAAVPTEAPERIAVNFSVALGTLNFPVVRMVIYPRAGCPEVMFLEADPASSAGVLRGEMDLVPGSYLVMLDVGGGFTSSAIEQRFIVPSQGAVAAGARKPLEVAWNLQDLEERAKTLRFDPRTRGYYSADLHVHTVSSGDGVTPIGDNVLAHLAADLDLVMISDHNTGAGHQTLIEDTARHDAVVLLGEEIITGAWGHINAYSLEPGRFVDPEPGMTPHQIFAAARALGASVIQVNHPYWGGNAQGYFNRMKDPDFDWGFDAVEVINGFNGELDEDDWEAIETVFGLWNQGLRVTAVGGSDDHNSAILTAKTGWPRTYVYLNEPLSAAAWLKALKAQRAFATTGPLVYLQVGEGIPGSDVRLVRGTPLEFHASLESVSPLSVLTVWQDGEAIGQIPLRGQTATLDWRVLVRNDGWFAVTVETEDGLLALTNPVWVKLIDKQEEPFR